MSIHYTGPMRSVLTTDVQHRIERSVAQFPELAGQKITVGLTRRADGTAEAERSIIRLNVRPRASVSYFTIGHELTHLLQPGGLGLVPSGEIQCDVWTLARSEVFLDDRPCYLCRHLWTRQNWPHHAVTVRKLCLQALDLRKTNRRYLVWLTDALERHAAVPISSTAQGAV